MTANRDALLIDTNLLVLWVVGEVNRARIQVFKRTSKYSVEDYRLLRRVAAEFKSLFTVAHVMAEVSNLTDLHGNELERARAALKAQIHTLREAQVTSKDAASMPLFARHGLVDASLAIAARDHRCTVITDDLNLYLALGRSGVEAINFTHLRDRNWRL